MVAGGRGKVGSGALLESVLAKSRVNALELCIYIFIYPFMYMSMSMYVYRYRYQQLHFCRKSYGIKTTFGSGIKHLWNFGQLD